MPPVCAARSPFILLWLHAQRICVSARKRFTLPKVKHGPPCGFPENSRMSWQLWGWNRFSPSLNQNETEGPMSFSLKPSRGPVLGHGIDQHGHRDARLSGWMLFEMQGRYPSSNRRHLETASNRVPSVMLAGGRWRLSKLPPAKGIRVAR